MGQTFAAFAALQPHDRFKIGACLREPCTLLPTTAPDFARLPVPRSGSTIATFLLRLQDALVPVLDSQLSSWTLGALVPRITALTDGVEICPGATKRLVALVRTNGYRTWGELAGCTIGEIRRWHGAGPRITTHIVIAAVATALRSPPGDWIPQLAPHCPPRDPVGRALDTLLADLPDTRGRFAFELDELRFDGARATVNRPPTNEFLGLSLERTRQLKVAAREQLLAVWRQDAAVEQRVCALATRLGLATDYDGLEAALESLALPAMSDPAGLLAVWLAGPYRPVPKHDGWWSPHPGELVEETEGLLSTCGGVHPYEVLIKDLIRIGVSEVLADGWLSRQGVRIEHGLVVDLGGRVGVVAARALEATGRAMSYSALCSWMPAQITASMLAIELNRNPMFVETGPDRWELADWGGEPSAHLVRIGIHVTPEVVSGAEAELSGEIATLLRLQPGVPLTFATRFGPMAVIYDGWRVMRGSARPVVLASGAAIGDVLWFVIDPRQSAAEVTVDPASSTNGLSTIQSNSTARSTA